MVQRGGRSYWKKIRQFRESIPEEDNRELDYDCVSRMDAVDAFERPWRDLINEHGYVPVVKCLRETRDIRIATKMLKSRHEIRQQQLATGSL